MNLGQGPCVLLLPAATAGWHAGGMATTKLMVQVAQSSDAQQSQIRGSRWRMVRILPVSRAALQRKRSSARCWSVVRPSAESKPSMLAASAAGSSGRLQARAGQSKAGPGHRRC